MRSFYQRFFRRQPDTRSGSGRDMVIVSGSTSQQMLAQVVGSDEYFRVRAHSSIKEFLVAVYKDLLNRAPDPAGEEWFIRALESGRTRTEIAQQIISSTEYQTNFVRNYYQRLLRRQPSADESSLWVETLQRGAGEEQIILALLTSEEYLSRR